MTLWLLLDLFFNNNVPSKVIRRIVIRVKQDDWPLYPWFWRYNCKRPYVRWLTLTDTAEVMNPSNTATSSHSPLVNDLLDPDPETQINADPKPWLRIRDPVPFWPLDPDPGSETLFPMDLFDFLYSILCANIFTVKRAKYLRNPLSNPKKGSGQKVEKQSDGNAAKLFC